MPDHAPRSAGDQGGRQSFTWVKARQVTGAGAEQIGYSLTMAASEPQDRTIILLPVFNDWEAVELLLGRLDLALAGFESPPEVLIVDDGSTLPRPAGFPDRKFAALRSVDVLRLRRNLGHQRAIAVGLVFVYQNVPCRAVVVMDADGEDRPEDIPRLFEEFRNHNEQLIVFAARAKRLERAGFRILYHTYRLVHWLLTGDPVRVGNFSIIPCRKLAQLAVTPEIWNHYAAAVIRSRLGFKSLPIARGKRLAGKSKMNFLGLLLHGLSAFFVYGEIIGARLLVGITLLFLLGFVLGVLAIALPLAPGVTVPGWSAYAAGFLCVILLEAILIALVLVFAVIGSRASINFLPVRDCPYFVSDVCRVFPA